MPTRVDNIARPITTIEAPAAAASIKATKQEVASKLEQLVVGKKIQGEILSRQNDGTFLVRLAGVTARMALPQNTKMGDALPLTLISITPRPTFLLEGQNGDATTTALFSRQGLIDSFLQNAKLDQSTTNLATAQNRADALLETNSSVDAELSDPHKLANSFDASAPTILSDTGKLIDSILKGAQQQGAASTLIGKSAILQSPEALTQPAALAASLQQTISSSGLFYESHVADWASGKLALSELMREPQMQSSNPANINAPPGLTDEQATLANIVPLQLNAMEQQRIAWRGELLPNTAMEWEITRRDEQSPDQQELDTNDETWQSTLRFELPNLGAVAAVINMHGGKLQVLLRTTAAETVNTLQEFAPALASALESIGSPLTSFGVKQDEQT
jgi:hypothetical protein